MSIKTMVSKRKASKKQRQDNRQAKKASKQAKRDAKVEKIKAKNLIKTNKAQAILDGTWKSPGSSIKDTVSGIVSSVFGGGASETTDSSSSFGGGASETTDTQTGTKKTLILPISLGVVAVVGLLVAIFKRKKR